MPREPRRVVLGRATYRATQMGNELLLMARGVHPTTGFREFFDAQDLEGRTPEFAFFFILPTGITLPVVTPFQHHERFTVDRRVEVVLIEDADGEHRIPVAQIEMVEDEAPEMRSERMMAALTLTCAQRVRRAVGDWAQNHDFDDDQTLEEIIRGRPCDNGQAIALSRVLRDQFGVEINLTCSTPVVRIIRRICG